LPRPSSDLDDVLVVTVHKSFWASPEAGRFPHRVYPCVYFGHGTNLCNSALGSTAPLPNNVEVEWTMPLHAFLERIARATRD
jgi:hypothetical protein